MDPTTTVIEKLNQGVRGIVTLGLTATFVFLAVTGKISGDVFTSVFAGILGYWFASRDSKAALAATQPTTITKTPSATTTTGPTPPPVG